MPHLPLVRPFKGLRPHPHFASDVAAPPYDVLTSEEARLRAAGKPHSFLHISKAEIDLPEGTDIYSPVVYQKAAENLQGLIQNKILLRDETPCYYVYCQKMGAHTQAGIFVTASTTAYDEARIRRHEFTRVDKEDDRVRQVEATNAQTGPAYLVHKDRPELEAIKVLVMKEAPVADFVADTGVTHTVWQVSDATQIDKISALLNQEERLYIADGHHRSAAASRVAKARPDSDAAQYFLAVAFPESQMRIMDYNRVVQNLHGLSTAAFLEKLATLGTLSKETSAVSPRKVGECGVYVDHTWYRWVITPERIPQNDPVKNLDVSVLSDLVLAPILGIADLRRDTRIDFVGGIRGLSELERRVDSGEMAVAFAMYPTPMRALIAVADENQIMPPKSTWFEPKLADGLLSHVLD